MMPRPTHKTAFTIAELLIVLAIIATMAGAAVVSLKGRADIYALNVGANDLAAAIRYAHNQSCTSQMRHRLTIDQTGTSYHILVWEASKGEYVPAEGMAGTIRQLPQGVRVLLPLSIDELAVEEINNVDFLPSGGGFSGRVYLENRLKDTAWIEVLPITGQVHVSTHR